MNETYLVNARIIDPKNQIDEIGGLIIDQKGKIKAVGKKVVNENLPAKAHKINVKKMILMPGLVDMRVFVGEPGYEYKENFRTLSDAALSGGVTSVVSMPNTSPVIDNVSMVDFLKRRGRDKSRINIFPAASLTKNTEGKQMTEFGLLKRKGISAFTDMKKGLDKCDIVMMLRLQNERMHGSFLPSPREYYEYFGLTPDKLAVAKKDALIMHPGPMNRGVEIDTILADDINRSVIREQVELGVAVRMACLKIFCKK